MTRPGLEAVAKRAKVGLATVDRVLNERGSVSPATVRRVIEAARELGLRRILPEPHARQARIELLLAKSTTPFLIRLAQAFGQVAATLDRSIVILRRSIDMTDPVGVAAYIAGCTADGLIVYCEEHPANVAAITAETAAGRPVICIATDVPTSSRFAYVGIDHTKAGRTAGFFAARMAGRDGPALVLTTSTGFRAHKERTQGFGDALALHRPGIVTARVMPTGDDPEIAYHRLTEALGQLPGTVAVYNTGGANPAVADAIRDHGPAQGIVFVGHELTEASLPLLREGRMTLAIDQAPELQARRAIDLMLTRLQRTPFGSVTSGTATGEIAFTLHTCENS